MTRDKAIEEVKNYDNYPNGLSKECRDYIIKALEQEPTTKNDLGVDYRSLKDIKKLVERKADALDGVMLEASGVIIGLYFAIANDLPSVTPQEPQTFKWCETCKEYDQEKHCCHRWSKVIRDTVEEMKQEPILDKIRAEIEEQKKERCFDDDDMFAYRTGLDDALYIIDKYKAESENN